MPMDPPKHPPIFFDMNRGKEEEKREQEEKKKNEKKKKREHEVDKPPNFLSYVCH